MADPLVSVFLPAYNQIAYIDEAIRSAVEQDYNNLEVLVGDDGSTDGTVDRIREWASRYPDRVIPVLGPHVGITANCNRIFRQVRGKYVFGHAGDDVFLPGKVRKQVDWLEEDERRVMCGHAAEAFDALTGQTLYLTTDSRPLVSGRGAMRMLDQFGLFPDISVAGRRSAYPPGGYDERVGLVSVFKINVDILASGGEYGYVGGVLARYRVHPESISRRSTWDPEVHRNFLEGYLTALAITEANHSHLVASCRNARARLLFSEGRWQQVRGGDSAARRYFAAAARDNPVLAWKAAAACALTYLPRPLRERIETRLRSSNQT
ncbi:MAG TPA: glycosyltransferase family A protein [Thermoanaerobaculia bacterium]|nr:glycosyltransferase family A protein [Thermoanaerobaculia bacterium]